MTPAQQQAVENLNRTVTHEQMQPFADDVRTLLSLASEQTATIMKLQSNKSRLIEYLLDEPWHKKCEIIPDFMPKNPREGTRPTVQIQYNDGTEYPPRLRYSKGPSQGYFWDIYGEDFLTVELAIIALSQAPAPVNVGPIVFKLNLPAKEVRL